MEGVGVPKFLLRREFPNLKLIGNKQKKTKQNNNNNKKRYCVEPQMVVGCLLLQLA
jgi:hypothetical protein